MKITESLIKQCLAELESNSGIKQKYKDYYDGNHSIIKDYDMQDSRSNRKLIFNLALMLVLKILIIHLTGK